MKLFNSALFVSCLLLFLGCGRASIVLEIMPNKILLSQGVEPVSNIEEALNPLFAKSNPIRFMSQDGFWAGDDTEREIELHANGTAALITYAYTTDRCEGTYSIDAEISELSLFLEECGSTFPPIKVFRDRSDLLLNPVSGKTPDDDEKGTWPYREFHKKTVKIGPFGQSKTK